MNNLLKLSIALLLLSLTACNKDVTIIGNNKKISSWHSPFTVILNKTVQFANGASQGIVKLQVFNNQSQPINGMFLSATPQTNTATFVNCTQSNSQGIIYCSFTATVPGSTQIDFTDNVNTFTTDIVFIDLPTKLSYTRVSNTKVSKQVNSGYTSYTGLRKTSWNKNTPGGANINTEAPIYKLDLTTSP